MKQFNVNRRMLSIILCIVLICTFTLSIAYAALSAVLTINGNAEVVASNWNIHLDNPRVSRGSVTKTLPLISGNTMTFSSSLVDPGDFYEFVVDVVNDGSIDAMIDSVSVTPTLTDSQKKYLRYEVTYQNGESISSKQTLRKGSSMPIKVRVEFRNDIPVSDLPSTATSLNHKVTLVYSQSDGTGSSVVDDGVLKFASTSGDINQIGNVVSIGSENFYVIGTEGSNVKLLSMYNLYVGGNYDQDNDTWSAYGAEATGIQDIRMRGIVKNESISYGTTKFASTTVQGILLSDYSGSIVETYVDNYKKILEEQGAFILEARLISEEELREFGCKMSAMMCNTSYNWIKSTSYWTGTADGDMHVWGVHSTGYFVNYSAQYNHICGVRPVIVIPRNSVVEKNMIEFTVAGITYLAEEGMTWAEWVDSELDIDDDFGIVEDYIGHLRIDDTDEFYEGISYNDGIDNVWNSVGINDTIIAGYTYFSG